MSVFGRLLGRRHDRAGLGRLDSVVRIGRLDNGLLRRRPRWAEAWQTYPGAVDDAPALWSVDLGAVEVAPMSHLPVRMDVVASYTAGPDGLPADWSQLVAIEDQVRANVSKPGVYVGRLASAGRCAFTAHLSAPPESPVVVSGAEVTTAYDPHWAYVRDTLAPDDRQYRLLDDLAVVGMLAELGDELSAPRQVGHVALFSDAEAARRAAAQLGDEGFAASVERDDEGDFALTAVREDPVAPPAVHDLAWSVKETVERFGGGYEGWNCDVR